jgi:hypothetical protein
VRRTKRVHQRRADVSLAGYVGHRHILNSYLVASAPASGRPACRSIATLSVAGT